jgi:hypothetical protein
MRSHVVTIGAVITVILAIVDDDYAAMDLVDLTAATIRLTSPSGTSYDTAATVQTPSSLGKIQMDTTSTMLSEVGTYTIQPYLVWSDGDQGWQEAVPLVVSAIGQLE